MNIRWARITGVVLIAWSMTAVADRAQDETDIRDVIEQINAAYTRQDAKAMAPLLAEDFETWDGIKGPEAVSQAWAAEKDRYRQIEELGIRFLTDDVAIFRERGEAWDVADTDQQAPDTTQFIETWVLVKRNSRWLPTAFFYYPLDE